MPPRNKTTLERLATIDSEIGHIQEGIKDIKDNHLKAIDKKFTDIWEKFISFEKKILSRLPGWATIIISLLSALVAGLAVYGIMRK